MSNSEDLAQLINNAIPELKRGSLAVWGDYFGKPNDNIHRVISASATIPDQLVVRFDEGEMLQVWEPGASVFSAKTFRISTAARVRWEWFYYGRPQTPENRFFIEHTQTDGVVFVTTDADWANATLGRTRSFALDPDKPAVQLIGGIRDDWEL